MPAGFVRIEILRVTFTRGGGAATFKITDDGIGDPKASYLAGKAEFMVRRGTRPAGSTPDTEIVTIRGESNAYVLVVFQPPAYHGEMAPVAVELYRRRAAMLIANIAVNAELPALSSPLPVVVLGRP